VAHGKITRPARLFPGLEGDAQDPAGALTHRGAKRIRETLAHGHDFTNGLGRPEGAIAALMTDNAIDGHTDKARTQTRPLHANGDFVIFGQIANEEWIAMVVSG